MQPICLIIGLCNHNHASNNSCHAGIIPIMALCPLCGPKLSAFCMVISVWGIVFLGLLGVFFHTQAVTLFPDLHLHEGAGHFDVVEIGERYDAKAHQCWLAAGLYAVTFIFVFVQNRFNNASIF